MQITNILLALSGGILPVLLWLWYWTKEDRLHPEPKQLLLLTFLAGGFTVALVIPLQQYARSLLGVSDMSPQLIVAWAGIEEVMKFLMVLTLILWRKAVDEPIDALIYMITIALGFSAIENTLFLVHPVATGKITSFIIMGNFRFLGATLLHTLSSSIIGITLALSFYKTELTKISYIIIGVILAVILHASFNLFILNSTSGKIIQIFAFVWLGIVILLLFFEKIKQIKILPRK